MRIARARALLADGATPVVVAAECGFADQPHLTRAFKRAVGVTQSVIAWVMSPVVVGAAVLRPMMWRFRGRAG